MWIEVREYLLLDAPIKALVGLMGVATIAVWGGLGLGWHLTPTHAIQLEPTQLSDNAPPPQALPTRLAGTVRVHAEPEPVLREAAAPAAATPDVAIAKLAAETPGAPPQADVTPTPMALAPSQRQPASSVAQTPVTQNSVAQAPLAQTPAAPPSAQAQTTTRREADEPVAVRPSLATAVQPTAAVASAPLEAAFGTFGTPDYDAPSRTLHVPIAGNVPTGELPVHRLGSGRYFVDAPAAWPIARGSFLATPDGTFMRGAISRRPSGRWTRFSFHLIPGAVPTAMIANGELALSATLEATPVPDPDTQDTAGDDPVPAQTTTGQ